MAKKLLPIMKLDRESLEVRAEALQMVKAELWRRGNLRHLCLPGAQTRLYDHVMRQPDRFPGEAVALVLMCHRRLGKSHLGAIMCVQRCCSHPGSEVWFCTDTKDHAREILEAKLSQILEQMPPDWSFRTRKNSYFIRHKSWNRAVESKLTMIGLNYSQGGQMRGSSADLIWVDEARDVKHLEYIVGSVMVPMFRGRVKPLLVFSTTPADNADHDVHRVYGERAKETDSYLLIPTTKNEAWTEADEKMMLQEYGSRDSLDYRRELLCEIIPNLDRLVIPCWPRVRDKIILPAEEYVRPSSYYGYVSADLGWTDHTGVVLALHDFFNKKLVILDEVFVKTTGTRALANKIRAKIQDTFYDDEDNPLCPIRMVADAKPDKLYDFRHEHGLHFAPARTHDKPESIASVVSAFDREQIHFLDTCRESIYTCSNLLYNQKRTDFERSPQLGHGDLFDAIRYLWRAFPQFDNPTKFIRPERGARFFVNPYDTSNWHRSGMSKDQHDQLLKAFGRKSR